MNKEETVQRLISAGFTVDERGPEGWAGIEVLTQELDGFRKLPSDEQLDALDDWGYRYLMAWASKAGVDWGHSFPVDSSKEERQAWHDAQPQEYRDAVARLEAYEKALSEGAPRSTLDPLFTRLREGIVGFKSRSTSRLN